MIKTSSLLKNRVPKLWAISSFALRKFEMKPTFSSVFINIRHL